MEERGQRIDWSAHLVVGGRYRTSTTVVIKGAEGKLCVPGIWVGVWGPRDPWESNQDGLPVVGLKAELLGRAEHEMGCLVGAAVVEGVWDGAALQVTRQELPEPAEPDEHRYPTELPGPAPAGGWPRWSDLGGTDAAGVPELAGLMAARPDIFGFCDTVYPTLVGSGIPVPDGPEVYLIGVYGDQDAARQMIEEVLHGSFFPVQMSRSRADVEEQFELLRHALTQAAEAGSSDMPEMISSFGPIQGADPSVAASVLVQSVQVQAFLDSIPGAPIRVGAWLETISTGRNSAMREDPA